MGFQRCTPFTGGGKDGEGALTQFDRTHSIICAFSDIIRVTMENRTKIGILLSVSYSFELIQIQFRSVKLSKFIRLLYSRIQIGSSIIGFVYISVILTKYSSSGIKNLH